MVNKRPKLKMKTIEENVFSILHLTLIDHFRLFVYREVYYID